jgi:hypothetical protein
MSLDDDAQNVSITPFLALTIFLFLPAISLLFSATFLNGNRGGRWHSKPNCVAIVVVVAVVGVRLYRRMVAIIEEE